MACTFSGTIKTCMDTIHFFGFIFVWLIFKEKTKSLFESSNCLSA